MEPQQNPKEPNENSPEKQVNIKAKLRLVNSKGAYVSGFLSEKTRKMKFQKPEIKQRPEIEEKPDQNKENKEKKIGKKTKEQQDIFGEVLGDEGDEDNNENEDDEKDIKDMDLDVLGENNNSNNLKYKGNVKLGNYGKNVFIQNEYQGNENLANDLVEESEENYQEYYKNYKMNQEMLLNIKEMERRNREEEELRRIESENRKIKELEQRRLNEEEHLRLLKEQQEAEEKQHQQELEDLRRKRLEQQERFKIQEQERLKREEEIRIQRQKDHEEYLKKKQEQIQIQKKKEEEIRQKRIKEAEIRQKKQEELRLKKQEEERKKIEEEKKTNKIIQGGGGDDEEEDENNLTLKKDQIIFYEKEEYKRENTRLLVKLFNILLSEEKLDADDGDKLTMEEIKKQIINGIILYNKDKIYYEITPFLYYYLFLIKNINKCSGNVINYLCSVNEKYSLLIEGFDKDIVCNIELISIADLYKKYKNSRKGNVNLHTLRVIIFNQILKIYEKEGNIEKKINNLLEKFNNYLNDPGYFEQLSLLIKAFYFLNDNNYSKNSLKNIFNFLFFNNKDEIYFINTIDLIDIIIIFMQFCINNEDYFTEHKEEKFINYILNNIPNYISNQKEYFDYFYLSNFFYYFSYLYKDDISFNQKYKIYKKKFYNFILNSHQYDNFDTKFSFIYLKNNVNYYKNINNIKEIQLLSQNPDDESTKNCNTVLTMLYLVDKVRDFYIENYNKKMGKTTNPIENIFFELKLNVDKKKYINKYVKNFGKSYDFSTLRKSINSIILYNENTYKDIRIIEYFSNIDNYIEKYMKINKVHYSDYAKILLGEYNTKNPNEKLSTTIVINKDFDFYYVLFGFFYNGDFYFYNNTNKMFYDIIFDQEFYNYTDIIRGDNEKIDVFKVYYIKKKQENTVTAVGVINDIKGCDKFINVPCYQLMLDFYLHNRSVSHHKFELFQRYVSMNGKYCEEICKFFVDNYLKNNAMFMKFIGNVFGGVEEKYKGKWYKKLMSGKVDKENNEDKEDKGDKETKENKENKE